MTFATKTHADVWLSGVETDMRRGSWLDPVEGAVRLNEYAEAWIRTRTVQGRPLRPRTASNYRALLRLHISPTLGDLPLTDLNAQRVRLWHSKVTDAGATAAAQSYRLLHAILATATTEGVYSRNPCQLRGAGRPQTAERPLITPAEADLLAVGMPERLQAFILLGFWGGLRMGELLALERGDLVIDEVAGTATVKIERQQQDIDNKLVVGPPKADSVRVVNLFGPVVESLTAHLERMGLALPSARLFTRVDGSPLWKYDIQRYWARARKAAGMEHVHIHDLRHGGLTLAAQSGATLAEVMRRAGHSSPRAAMIYQHAAADRDASLAERMAEVARGAADVNRARSGHATVSGLPSAKSD